MGGIYASSLYFFFSLLAAAVAACDDDNDGGDGDGEDDDVSGTLPICRAADLITWHHIDRQNTAVNTQISLSNNLLN